ncbi:MAG: NADH-quinone oxidoreductase subunit C [Legionellales bacterium]|nr:NADH-quinone oxidoreductase subunit C [Legionellales bacterium]
MASVDILEQAIQETLGQFIHKTEIKFGQLTVYIMPDRLRHIAHTLKEEPDLQFEELLDVCGVDYQEYGLSEWETEKATSKGFERAANRLQKNRVLPPMPARFACVYHLLSVKHNHRVRLKAWLNDDFPMIDSVIGFWPAANWFEREAFDLYGILFNGHPDLRRILTDYGFIGHPFRKDFPLIGNVEMRYDAAMGRVVYEPVSITPRVLVPRVIREDNRYINADLPPKAEEGSNK